MSTAFKLYVDVDDDGTFDQEYTSSVLEMTWSIGFANDIDAVAQLSTAEITFDDTPITNPYADLINHKMRITSETGAGPTIRTHFTGFLKDIVIDVQTTEAVFICVGLEEPLYTQRISIPIMQNATAEDIIAAVLDRVNFRLVQVKDILRLDHTTEGVLGKKLGDISIPRSLDKSTKTYPYAGDDWDNKLAIDIIRDVVTSESGKFWTDRAGTLIFKEKANLIRDNAANQIVDSAVIEMQRRVGKHEFNATNISFSGRDVGTPLSTIFQIDEPLLIRAGRSRKLSCRYRDSSKNPIGALAFTIPTRFTDYIANSDGTDTSSDYTTDIVISLIDEDGSRANFEIYHLKPIDLYLGTFKIRGTPLAKSNPITIELIDWTLATTESIRYLPLSAPLLSNSALAEDLGRFELARRRKTQFQSWSTDWIIQHSQLADVFENTLKAEIITFGLLTTSAPGVPPNTTNIYREEHTVSATKGHTVKNFVGVDWAVFGIIGPWEIQDPDTTTANLIS